MGALAGLPAADARAQAAPCPSPTCVTQETSALEWKGELRERVLQYRPARFGIASGDDDYAIARGLSSLEWRGARLRAFAQLGAHAERGRKGGPARTDQGALDAQQAWLGWQDDDWSGWLGRQEIAYGSSRLISRRDGPNIRLAFEGLRASRQTQRMRIDAFVLRPVENRAGSFDDRADPGQGLWGVYASRAAGAHATGLDAYLLGYRRDGARFAGASGDETRRSLGLRAFGHRGRWDWNLEGVYQWGRIRSSTSRVQDISAWTVASDSGYTFDDTRGSPRISMKIDLASGDGDASDRRLQTFNALYPRASYFSEASLIAPANLFDAQPALTMKPRAGLEITTGWNFVWKHRRADAVYTTPTPLTVVPGTAGTSRRVGDQFKLEARQALAQGWELQLHLAHFRAGPALREAGGGDVDFASVTLGWQW